MALKPPQQPEAVLDQCVQELAQALGTDLVSVTLFGSAAAGRYRPGQSDINLLVITTPGAGAAVARLAAWMRRWRPAALAPPLVFAQDELAASVDVFPLELLTMAASHQVLHGEDPLADLVIDPGDLRLQLEREVKAKLIALRQGTLLAQGEAPALTALLARAATALTALLQGWLWLRQGSFPADPEQVLAAAIQDGLELEALGTLLHARRDGGTPGGVDLAGLARRLDQELAALGAKVDAWS